MNETFIFNNRDQKEGETFESFHAAIRSLAKMCNYCDVCINSILRDRIVIGIRDAIIQTTLLKELNLTLETCVTIWNGAENAIAQRRQLRPETVHRVVTHRRKDKSSSEKPIVERGCKFCGMSGMGHNVLIV